MFGLESSNHLLLSQAKDLALRRCYNRRPYSIPIVVGLRMQWNISTLEPGVELSK